jgi:hypothetical protein
LDTTDETFLSICVLFEFNHRRLAQHTKMIMSEAMRQR